jgi:hypothetical protein
MTQSVRLEADGDGIGSDEHNAEPDHSTERGRAASGGNPGTTGRPRRSVLAYAEEPKAPVKIRRQGFLWALLSCMLGLLTLTGVIKWGLGLGGLGQSELLAKRFKDQPGCVNEMRRWFNELRSISRSPQTGETTRQNVSIPSSLDSPWWHTATATAVYSPDGTLNRIDVHEPLLLEWIVIGEPSATPWRLGLRDQAGSPPFNPAQIAEGIYAWILHTH